jgi:Gametolysin peptidase M11/NPCBM-associated, NEW3 domain of alpha-galactosidase
MFAWSPQSKDCHKLTHGFAAVALGALLALLPATVLGQTKPKKVLDGTLEVLHEDRPQGSRYHYFLNSTEGRVKLKLPDDGHAGHKHNGDHQTGDRVRVRGEKIGETLALDSGAGGMQTLSQVFPNTFGPQKTLVLLVNFQDNASQPYSTDYAQDVVFNTTSNFHYENSYGQTWLEGDVRGWFTLPINGATCDFNAIYFAARQAATDAGIHLADYKRFIYAFPSTDSCGWWGLGTVGGNPSHAWINGSLQLRVVGHETGHNLGLYHSHALECGATTIGSSCTKYEYGDTVDIMGSTAGHYNAYQKEWLGWLNYGASPPVTTADQDGVYAIDNYELPGTNPKAVKILKATDPNTGYKDWYYVERRQALGFDDPFSTNANLMNGVVVHTGSESSPDTSYLLDMTPETGSWFDPALGVGQSFYDPTAGVTISVLSADNSGASISVSYGPPQCTPGNPLVSLSGPGQAVAAGTTVTYTVTIKNNDFGCAASTFNLQGGVPEGWTAELASSVSIDAGATQSLSFRVTSPFNAAAGSYGISATATKADDAGSTSSATSSYQVNTSAVPSLSVSTNAAVVTLKKQVAITARLSSTGLPVGGKTVTFSVTKPDGTVVTATYLTKKNGIATYKFRTTLLDPKGTYWASADAGNAGASLGGLVTTSFVVQ